MPNDRPHGLHQPQANALKSIPLGKARGSKRRNAHQMYDPLCSPSVTAYSRWGLERRRAFDGDAAAASGDARCRLPRAEEYCRR